MEFSLRQSPFNKSYDSSSTSRYHLLASNDSHHSTYDDNDDDERIPLKDHPILSYVVPNLHHNFDVHNDEHTICQPMIPSTHGGEVIVKIDATVDENNNMNNENDANSMLWKGPSEEFSFPKPNNESKEEDQQQASSSIGSGRSHQDPTTKLIGQFLEQQKAQCEMSLDMDIEMEELQQNQQEDHKKVPRQVISGCLRPPLPPDSCWSRNPSEIQSPEYASSYQYKNTPTNNNSNNDRSREIRVSFHESLTSELVRRPSSMYSNVHNDSSSCSSSTSGETNYDGNNIKDTNNSEEISRSRSNRNINASFQRMASTLSKTKSRLIDPASSTPFEQRSGIIHKSGQLNMRSGLLGKGSMYDDDEDDPFLEDHFPDELKSPKTSTLMVLEWVSLILIMGALMCSLIIPVLRHKTLWSMRLWKWEVLILVLICGRLVSDWGIRILVFFIEMNFLLRKRVLYFVYGLKKAVQNVIWLGLVLIAWYCLFDKKVLKESKSHPLEVVTRLLILGEVGTILWLVKTLLVKVLASNFRVKAYFDRIQDSLFNQFVIETLSAPPMFEFQQAQEEDDRTMAEVQSLQNAGINVPLELRSTVFARNKSGRSSIIQRTPYNNEKHIGSNATPYKSPIGQSTRYSTEPMSKKYNDDGITIDHLHKLNQKNVSAWNMKRLMRIIRKGGLTTLDEHLVDAPIHDDESQTQIRSEVEAKVAARKIFHNVAKPHSRYIYMDDILRFMKEDEAMKTMSLFEGAIENERISKKSLKNWVVYAFRERRALALTLSDTKSAVNKLHKMLSVIVIIIIIVIGLISLDIVTSQSLLFLSSQLVLAAFVFGNTCKNLFECIIFLFVIHPYDVGDRCEIDTIQMVVEEINILTTVFLRYDNLKIVFPNYTLLTKPIYNFYRSPDMGDGIELFFHIATPAEKIALIRQRITSYIENKKEHWYPGPMIILKDVDGLQMLRIAVWLTHRMNHQDMGERFVRRALLIEECIKIFRELDIEYRLHPLNVNVTSLPPLNYSQIPPCNWNAQPSDAGKELIHH